MLNIDKIIIDIRTIKEVERKRIVSNDPRIIIMHVPLDYIGYNRNWIRTFSKRVEIKIMCNRGNRSKMIKKKYFNNNDNITSLKGGIHDMYPTKVSKKNKIEKKY